MSIAKDMIFEEIRQQYNRARNKRAQRGMRICIDCGEQYPRIIGHHQDGFPIYSNPENCDNCTYGES